MSRWFPIVLSICLPFLVGCPPERPDVSNASVEPEEVSEGGIQPVAVINGDVLTKAEFERRLNTLSPVARSRFAAPEARKKFLESQVQFEILADIAEEKGYGRRAPVIHSMKETMVRLMLAEELREKVSPTDITDEEIQRHYRENRYDFVEPEQRRVSVVVSGSEKVSKRLYDELQRAFEEREGESRINGFRMTAERHGIFPKISTEGGDIGWIADPRHPANQNTGRNKFLAPKVFDLEGVGDYTQPLEYDGDWYIAMVIDRRPSDAKTLEEVEDRLRDKLYEKRRREVRDELLNEYAAKARVEVDEKVLETIEKPDPAEHDSIPSLFEVQAPVRDLRPRGEKP